MKVKDVSHERGQLYMSMLLWMRIVDGVTNEEQALNYLFEGETKKTFAATKMNDHSSRAHSVYTIYIQSKSKMEATEKVIHSKLHLVDLAGTKEPKSLRPLPE